MASRRALAVLAVVSLALTLGAAVLVRSVFTGALLEEPARAAAGVEAPPFPAPPPPQAGIEPAPEAPPREPDRAAPVEPEPAEEPALSPPDRPAGRDRDLEVSARLRERAQEVRQARRRYRELEREVAARGGVTNPAAQDAVAELEEVARELRRAEAALDRARRRHGGG